MTRIPAIVLSLLFAATAVAQPTYRIHRPSNWGPLYLGDLDCNRSLYDPSVFVLPNGDLRVASQGGNPDAMCGSVNTRLDSVYAVTRAAATGNWTLPTTTSCPLVAGAYTRCGYNNTTQPGPIGSPSVVKVGGWYYMAVTGGNADYFRGHIYWARSSDGTNWQPWTHNPEPGDTWSSIVRPINPVNDPGNGCKGPETGHSVNGVGQLSLVYDPRTHATLAPNGWFYLFFNYYHQPLSPNYVSGTIPPVDMMAYRFSYDPAHSFGFGTTKQIWRDGQWRNISSGNMLNWNYSGNPPFGSDPVLEPGKTMSGGAAPMRFGGGELFFDPDRPPSFSGDEPGWWVWMYKGFENNTYWQKTERLDIPSWSAPQQVILTGFTDPSPQSPGVWKGTLSGINRWWAFVPAHSGNCGGFYGLQLMPAQLDYY